MIDNDRVVIEGVNIVIKHVKRGRARQAGRVEIEAPLPVSKVKLVCPSCSKPTRVGVHAGRRRQECALLQKVRERHSAAGADRPRRECVRGWISAGASGPGEARNRMNREMSDSRLKEKYKTEIVPDADEGFRVRQCHASAEA